MGMLGGDKNLLIGLGLEYILEDFLHNLVPRGLQALDFHTLHLDRNVRDGLDNGLDFEVFFGLPPPRLSVGLAVAATAAGPGVLHDLDLYGVISANAARINLMLEHTECKCQA